MREPKNIEKYGDRYSDEGLWRKLSRVARRAGQKPVYVVLLLYYTLQSPTLSMADKAKIYGALGYFILPTDIVPDLLPLIGFSDDIAALMFVFHTIVVNITPQVKLQARNKLSEWFGSCDQKLLDEVFEENTENTENKGSHQ